MYRVKVESKSQLNISIEEKNVSDIILSRDSFTEIELPNLVSYIKSKGKKAYILFERITRYEENMLAKIGKEDKSYDLRKATDKIYDIEELDGVFIQNLDSFAYMLRKINVAKNKKLEVELYYTMNCYNGETKKVYERLYNDKRVNAEEVPLRFTAPVELNSYELSDVGYDTCVVYGYIDTMVSANCLRKNQNLSGTCKNRFNYDKVENFDSSIVDRKNKYLHYKTYCKFCYNKIFNTEPLYLLDKQEIINEYKPLILFSFENEKQVNDIFAKKIPTSFTRGHIKTSIN